MNDTAQYIHRLFSHKGLQISGQEQQLFERFLQSKESEAAVTTILATQQKLMKDWKTQSRVYAIQNQSLSLANATVGKVYEANLNFQQLQWTDLSDFYLEGLENYGLTSIWDSGILSISGTPTQAGDAKIVAYFRLEGQEPNSPYHQKMLTLIINPDAKSLWKNIPSDKKALYWKEDEIADFAPLGEKYLIVASKRGRSHANVGSFRDDHYSFKYFEQTQWSVVVVADGAGSAKFSRQGSRHACDLLIDYFTLDFIDKQIDKEFDSIIHEYQEDNAPDKKLNASFLFQHLGRAVLDVHNRLAAFAKGEEGISLKEFNTTFIFALFKKFEFGYVILTFGVGDCPIALINTEQNEVRMMNWLDVGEFGGGTRFLTNPDIFQAKNFYSRFNCKIISNFSYLFLMTDGIYDPKFGVEINLDKIEKWQEFLRDLDGENEDYAKVELNPSNELLKTQLLTWMDFWSKGNHDDRTLAIIF